MYRYVRQYVCIDVDIDGDKSVFNAPLSLEKALLQYSYIERRAFRTRHGIHVYLPFRVDDDLYRHLAIRSIFGDDKCRVLMDEIKGNMGYRVNRCFSSSELYEVDVWRILGSIES